MRNPSPFIRLLGFTLLFWCSVSEAVGPLAPLKLDHPRDTMRTFMTAMTEYRSGKKPKRLDDAVRTLNLTEVPAILRSEKGRDAAILLKEIIDRVILIDYSKIPADSEPPIARWRLKDTEVTIARVDQGEQAGEYLFSPNTVARAFEFYSKVQHLPYLEGSTRGAGYRKNLLSGDLPEWAQEKVILFENWQWIGLLLAILLGLVARLIVRTAIRVTQRIAAKRSKSQRSPFFELLERPVSFLAACGVWYFSVQALKFTGSSLYTLTVLVQILLSVGVIRLFYGLADFIAQSLRLFAKSADTPLDDQLIRMVSKVLRVLIVAFGVLLVVQNLGFNVMSVFAGLGLGGLAFALAAKDTAANLFGSLMILLDKPFKVGDWIVVDGQEGTVVEIGFRSTRVRTFYDSLVSVPNSVIVNKNIDNMGRRRYRRIRTILGLTYSTTPEQMEAFLEGVKNIILANSHTRKDYFHVVFSGYGASSLEVLLYCFLEVSDWADELVQRQNLYLEILRLAKRLGVGFAFPTHTLHVESFPGQEAHATELMSDEELRNEAKSFSKGGANAKPAGVGIFTPPHKETSV